MIGKLTQGTNFQGCLSYVLGKPGADRLGGNAIGNTVEELSAEFNSLRQRRSTLQRAVYHLSLSLSPGEQLEDADWEALADEYLQRMGLTNTKYVVARHTDTDRDHIHIVANRIRLDGSAIDDSWDYTRSQVILRDLEQKYGLTPVPSSHAVERRSPTRRQLEKAKQTGSETAKVKLQRLIDDVLPNASTLADLRDRLAEQSVSVRFTYSKNGIPKGISFFCDGVALAGHHLGTAYSLPALRRRLPAPDRAEVPALQDQALQIQTAIEASPATNLGEFVDSLQAQGISVHLKSKRSRYGQQETSFSYAIGQVSFLDVDLGAEFTLRHLRQRLVDETTAPTLPAAPTDDQSIDDNSANLARQLYEFLARSLRDQEQVQTAEELDLAIARYIVQNGTQADVKALVYSPQVQQLRQEDSDQADRYLQMLLRSALEFEQQVSFSPNQERSQ